MLKAFRADPSKSIVDHLQERSKVAEGLRAQDIVKLRESERSLQHFADYLCCFLHCYVISRQD